jgi:hypothetical protein
MDVGCVCDHYLQCLMWLLQRVCGTRRSRRRLRARHVLGSQGGSGGDPGSDPRAGQQKTKAAITRGFCFFILAPEVGLEPTTP